MARDSSDEIRSASTGLPAMRYFYRPHGNSMAGKGLRAMGRTGQPANRQISSVARAMDVLSALAEGDDELGTNELARRTGINASTVSRLLATLASGALVEHVPETGRYRLGVGLLQLGNAVLRRLDLRAVARPHLRELVALVGETATLAVPGGQVAMMVEFVLSPSSVQSRPQVGRPSVGHATATGKVMLAFGGGEPPPGPLAGFTTRTIRSKAVLAEELARVREQGWAQATGEREDDLNAVATPIFGGDGELVGMLGMQGPSQRFGPRRMRAALGPLRERAAVLSTALGWQPPTPAPRAGAGGGHGRLAKAG